MTLLLSCSNSVRLDTYRTLKEKTGIAEILQSDNDVKDDKDICSMAEKELSIRVEYFFMVYQGKAEKDNMKFARYEKEMNGIIDSYLVSEKYAISIVNRYKEVYK